MKVRSLAIVAIMATGACFSAAPVSAGDALDGWTLEATPNPAPLINALLDVHALSPTTPGPSATTAPWDGRTRAEVALPPSGKRTLERHEP